MKNPAVEKAWAEIEKYSMIEHAATELHEHMSIAIIDLRYRLDEMERAKAPATPASSPTPDDAAAIEAALAAMRRVHDRNGIVPATRLDDADIEACRAYHAVQSAKDAETIAELRKKLAERDKIIKRWSDAGLKHYPPNWACDFGNPEMVIGNIARWWDDRVANSGLVTDSVIENGEIIVMGIPPVEEAYPEDSGHNCDQMGCGTTHVLFRKKVSTLSAQPAPGAVPELTDEELIDAVHALYPEAQRSDIEYKFPYEEARACIRAAWAKAGEPFDFAGWWDREYSHLHTESRTANACREVLTAAGVRVKE